MKKFLSCLLIICLIYNTICQAKSILKTSITEIPLNKYNVAIVGNSHASSFSYSCNIDNDVKSYMLSNHGIGGDDLASYGCVSPVYTTWKDGHVHIAEKGDCKGRLQDFINEAKDYEYAILWFGSNSITQDLDKFKEDYKKYLDNIRKQTKTCKLIVMGLPYITMYTQEEIDKKYKTLSIDNFDQKRYENYLIDIKYYNLDIKETDTSIYDKISNQYLPIESKYSRKNRKENIDKYNKVIKELINEYTIQDNIYFQELPKDLEYMDRCHLSENCYRNIWKIIKERFNIEITVKGD